MFGTEGHFLLWMVAGSVEPCAVDRKRESFCRQYPVALPKGQGQSRISQWEASWITCNPATGPGGQTRPCYGAVVYVNVCSGAQLDQLGGKKNKIKIHSWQVSTILHCMWRGCLNSRHAWNTSGCNQGEILELSEADLTGHRAHLHWQHWELMRIMLFFLGV